MIALLRLSLLVIIAVFGCQLHSQEFKLKKKTGKYLYQDSRGKLHPELAFDKVDTTTPGLAIVTIDDRKGGLNWKGELIIPVMYDQLEKVDNHLNAGLDDKTGIIAFDGELLVPVEYDWVDYYDKGEALVSVDGSWKLWQDGKLTTPAGEIILRNPEHPAHLAECSGIEEQESCSEKAMLMTMYRNIRYPAEARNNGIQGDVLMEIVFTKTGEIESITMLEGIGHGFDEAAQQAVERLREHSWQPATHQGEIVRSKLVFPIRFKLH